jgi:hypothetical protein
MTPLKKGSLTAEGAEAAELLLDFLSTSAAELARKGFAL